MLCANQWLQYAHKDTKDERPLIVEKFQSMGNLHRDSYQDKISPLVRHSSEFALIIDPPKPPAPPEIKAESPQPKVTPTAFAPRPSARFRLLATSYNRDRPEDSVALVSEPGRGEH